MSSFTRFRAQIPPRESFLLSLSGCQVFTRDFTDAVLNVSTATGYDLSAATGYPAGLPENTLLRDMGRSLTLFMNDAAGRSVKVAVLREVQIVNGAGTEGVSDITPYLIPVWADATASAFDVLFTRCG